MKTLQVTTASVWRSLNNKIELTVTHLTEDKRIGVAFIENGKVCLAAVEREQLFENYERLS